LLSASEVSAVLKRVRPSHLLHLAWYTDHDTYWQSPENLAWVQASLNLIKEFADSGGQRIVAAGTCAEYSTSYEVCKEEITPCRPSSLYGATKYGTYLILNAWAKQANISSAWGRLFFLYGPGQPPSFLIPSIATSLLKGEQALCSHGDLVRDYIYVEDAAAALASLLEVKVEGSVNVASGQALEIKDLVLMVGDLLDKRDFIHFRKQSLGHCKPQRLIADVSRLKSELGFQPYFDISRGLSVTLDYLKASMKEV
jgi:nucleoside-diphosphate-sugar epimerase